MRNPAWESILDALIELREKEGVPVEFMIQVDVASYKIPGFVEKAAKAGCSNVFIGMESINPESIKDAGKAQNKVADYRNPIDFPAAIPFTDARSFHSPANMSFRTSTCDKIFNAFHATGGHDRQ